MPSKICTCSCPPSPLLPLGTLAPGSSNQSRSLQQAQKVRCLPGSITVADKSKLQSGTYLATTALIRQPVLLTTIYFDTPFVRPPIVNVTINDYGNNAAWIVHVRNLSNVSFDIVLKGVDKATGVQFSVLWNAIGV